MRVFTAFMIGAVISGLFVGIAAEFHHHTEASEAQRVAIADGCGEYNIKTGAYERVNMSALLMPDTDIELPGSANIQFKPMPVKKPRH